MLEERGASDRSRAGTGAGPAAPARVPRLLARRRAPRLHPLGYAHPFAPGRPVARWLRWGPLRWGPLRWYCDATLCAG